MASAPEFRGTVIAFESYGALGIVVVRMRDQCGLEWSFPIHGPRMELLGAEVTATAVLHPVTPPQSAPAPPTTQSSPGPEWMTANEFCAEHGFTRTRLSQLRREGRIHADRFKRVDRRLYVRRGTTWERGLKLGHLRALEPERGWVLPSVFAAAHGVGKSSVSRALRDGRFSEGDAKKVEHPGSSRGWAWVIRSDAPCPIGQRGQKIKDKPPKPKKRERKIEPPQPGDEEDGRAGYLKTLRKALDLLATGKVIQLLVERYGATELSDRLGVEVVALRSTPLPMRVEKSALELGRKVWSEMTMDG